MGSWWDPVSYNPLGTSFYRSRDAFCLRCDMPKCRESFLFLLGSSCLSDREIRLADVTFLSGIHLLMEFLSFFHSIHMYEVPTMSQFNSNLSLLALIRYLLTKVSYASFQSAFITTMLFHIQGNQVGCVAGSSFCK